jgi:hypothetical protein
VEPAERGGLREGAGRGAAVPYGAAGCPRAPGTDWDSGLEEGLLMPDLSFACDPRCACDRRRVCALTPAANRPGVAVRGGGRR